MTRTWLVVGAALVVAVALAAFLAAGGTGSPGPAGPGGRLGAWVEQSGLGQDIGTLVGDGAAVRRTVAAHRGTGALHAACAAMANDAQTFNDQLPSPDAQVTQWLARAYGLDYDAAETCYGSSGGPALGRAASERRAADALFTKVLRRVRSLTGRSLLTTTTTGPALTGTGFG